MLSKFLLCASRPVKVRALIPSASSIFVSSSWLTSPSPSLIPSHSTRTINVSTRLYSTPASASHVSDPSILLDKAPNVGEAFTLPPPPTPPAPVSAIDPSTASLTDLGLGGYSPPGLVQHALDGLHSLGLPWWISIVIGGVAFRACMVPLFAAVQRNSINMLNHAPEIQQFQMKMMAAHQVGDRVGVLRISKELKQYMRDNDISHFRQMKLFAGQAIVFCSMFLGVRGMAELPIESFKTEGLLHIVDLSTRDPLFILPTLTMSSLALSLYLGAEGIPMHDFPPIFKKIMMVIPVIAFIPVAYFPAGMSLYWVTSNFFSLGQFLLFRSEFGKKLFRIPPKRDNPNGWGMGQFTDKVSFAEQFTKMVETAQEAANTQAKLQSMRLPEDREKWEGLQPRETIPGAAPLEAPLSPEEVAARHKDIRKMIKEINEMKKKVEELNPDVKKSGKTNKPPDIHIKIPDDKQQ